MNLNLFQILDNKKRAKQINFRKSDFVLALFY